MAGVDQAGFEAGDDTIIWRYTSVAWFESLLVEGLYFAAAQQFDDQFEGSITDAAQALRERCWPSLGPSDRVGQEWLEQQVSEAFGDLRRMTKISCWHALHHENAAMWDRYLGQNAGVAIRSTVGSLKRALRDFRLRPEYGAEPIVVAKVRYIDYATEEMTDDSMLGIFLHKRLEFCYEREVRALLSLRVAVEFGISIPNGGLVVAVDHAELIDEVRLWRAAADEDIAMVRALVHRAGVSCPVGRSTLARAPRY